MSAGKGSALRPTQVSKEELASNWENTFGKKKTIIQAIDEEIQNRNNLMNKENTAFNIRYPELKIIPREVLKKNK